MCAHSILYFPQINHLYFNFLPLLLLCFICIQLYKNVLFYSNEWPSFEGKTIKYKPMKPFSPQCLICAYKLTQTLPLIASRLCIIQIWCCPVLTLTYLGTIIIGFPWMPRCFCLCVRVVCFVHWMKINLVVCIWMCPRGFATEMASQRFVAQHTESLFI